MKRTIRVTFLSGAVVFAEHTVTAKQAAVSNQGAIVSPTTPVTPDGDFVQFDNSDGHRERERTADIKVGDVIKRVIIQERYPIKKDHLESIPASLQPGD